MEFLWNTDFYGFHGFFPPLSKTHSAMICGGNAAISAKTFLERFFGSACGVQLWAGARPAKPGCHSTPAIRVFSRGPGLATAQKSVRRGKSYATAAISAKIPSF
jgi:hypothetical protein